VAGWADGFITVNQPADDLRRVLDAYREAGGRGAARLQVHLSWSPDPAEALALAHDQWRTNVYPPPACWDIDHVEVFDAIAETVTPERVLGTVLVSADTRQHVDWLAGFADLGFDEIYLHHVGQDQQAFIDTFGAEVLPQVAQ